MATKVQAATLINTVRYQTDRNSLKRVRKELKDLQTQVGKTMAQGTPGAARQAVRTARQNAAAVVDAHVKSFEEISKQRAKQSAKNVQNNLNAMFGIDKVKKSARDSANVFKASFADQAETVKKQNAAMDQYNKKMLAQQSTIDDMRDRILKARAAQEKRDRNANRVNDEFTFQAQRLKLTRGATDEASRAMEGLNKRYREGAIELADYRQQTRHLLTDLRSQSKEFMTWRERLADFRKGGSGGLGMRGMALGLGVAGGIGAAYLGQRAASESLRSGVEQIRGLQRANTMGLSTEQTQALQLASLRETGINLSYEKISDIAKDVQDKVGQLSLGKWTQNKKTGEWSFGGGGELGDWVKIMTERGGYGRDEAVQTLQNAKGPVEFGLILQNLRKSAKLTDSEFTALSEAINDFSYITKAMGPDAQNVVSAMQELARVGFLYTDQEKENLQELSNLSAQYTAVTQVLQGKFASSFVEGLNEAGINSRNFSTELAGANPLVKGLGEFAGQTAGQLLKLANALPEWWSSVFGTRNVENKSGWYYDDSALGWGINGIKSLFGMDTGENWNPQAGFNTQAALDQRYANFAVGNPYSMAGQVPVQSSVAMTIQIDPDADAIGRAFSAHATDVFNNGIDDLTFQVDNMTSNN